MVALLCGFYSGELSLSVVTREEGELAATRRALCEQNTLQWL